MSRNKARLTTMTPTNSSMLHTPMIMISSLKRFPKEKATSHFMKEESIITKGKLIRTIIYSLGETYPTHPINEPEKKIIHNSI